MKNFKIFFAILNFTLLPVIPVFAAEIFFSSSYPEYNRGDIFQVYLNLNTQGEAVNACDIGINYDPAVLEVLELSNGDSILSLWPQSPAYSNELGQINFSGGIPNGFNGGGKMISIIFRAIGPGLVELSLKNDSKVLLNDGNGTEAKVNINNISLNVLPDEKQVKINEWEKSVAVDLVAPEPFEIKIKKDPGIFEGKYFIVFSTVDSGTGVDHYEIKEGNSEWKTGKSPYLLEDQSVSNKIFVKAVDKAGNSKESEITIGLMASSILCKWIIGFVALIFIILLFVAIALKRKKIGKSKGKK